MLPLRTIDTRVLGMLVLFLALLSGPPGCDGSNSGNGDDSNGDDSNGDDSNSEGSCDGSDSAMNVEVVILDDCNLTETAAVACSAVVCSFSVTIPEGDSVDYSGTPPDSAMFLNLINGTLTPPATSGVEAIVADCSAALSETGKYPVQVTEVGSGGATIICRAEIPFSVTITDPP